MAGRPSTTLAGGTRRATGAAPSREYPGDAEVAVCRACPFGGKSMSDQPLPPEAYGLGRPVAEYKTRRDLAILGLVMIVLGGIAVGGVFAWKALGLPTDAVEECLVGGLGGVGVGLLLSVAAAFMGRRRVMVFAEGMLHTRRGKHTVVRWNDVERVLLYEPGPEATARRCTVQTKYGDKLVIAGSIFGGGRQLADIIQEEATKREIAVYVVRKPLTTVDSSGNVVPD